MTATFRFCFPNTYIGLGEIQRIGECIVRCGGSRVLIVTDRNLAALGLIDECVGRIRKAGFHYAVFDRCQPDAPIQSIHDCVHAAKSESIDLIVGFGGGSVMDTAKMASVLIGVEGDLRNYLLGDKRNLLAPKRVLPLVLIPSTAGSGSEWGRGAIFKDEVSGQKGPFHTELMQVREVIIDPQLMRDLPPRITGDTGMDALCHAIETYTAVNATVMSDLFASQAIFLVASNLRAVYTGAGDQQEARYNMALAAAMALGSGWLTGTSEKRGQLAHGLAYPLQDMAVPAVSHGVSVSLLLPHVMEFNVPKRLRQFVHIAELMGVGTEGMTPEEAAMQSISAVRELSMDVGIPQRMRDVGIKKTDISQMVENVMTRRAQHAAYNCRPATTEDVTRIFESAY